MTDRICIQYGFQQPPNNREGLCGKTDTDTVPTPQAATCKSCLRIWKQGDSKHDD